jgi:phosphatidylinositol N-acetylglucosaminyltransferase subunit Q
MVKKNELLRIFWPSNLSRTTTPGVVVGWRNSDTDLFVITILEDVEARNVEYALRTRTLFRNSPYPVARIFQICTQQDMVVLGDVNYPDPPQSFNIKHFHAYTIPQTSKPLIHCPQDAELSIQVILFDPPDPIAMQYMSLRPISLVLGERSSESNRSASSFNEIEAEEQMEKKRIAQLVEKLKFHTVLRHTPSPKEMALPMILSQINCSLEIAELLQKNITLVGPRRKRSMSVSERVVESAQDLYAFAAWSSWSLFMAYAFPGLSRGFQIAVIAHRILSEAILQILEWELAVLRLRTVSSDEQGKRSFALKDLSACCQQVHLRLQQFTYYPVQYMELRKRHDTWSSIPTRNSDYIRFYNSLWLVVNDVIIGIALGSFIIENATATSDFLARVLNGYTIEGLERMIRWLMSYPGGLKLNTELAAFLGDLFLWVIEYWSTTSTLVVMPHLPKIIYFIGFSSFAGASLPISIFSDLLSLLTLHIYCFYIASARIFNWQLTIIFSLFQLFRGKKRNVLRNRIDNCDYDLDQLLLGTILFTLLFFLLPTVIVFYLTFASARMAIITLKATLDTCLACLNHFPLFALMLRLKDSKRLPGGIYLALLKPEISKAPTFSDEEGSGSDLDEESARRQSTISYVSLSSTPLSIRQIFSQYFQLGSRIQKHYLSPTVFSKLLTGRFIPPISRDSMYQMQYTVLPRTRVAVSELWKRLTEIDIAAISPANGKAVPSAASRFQHRQKWK